MGAHGEFFMAIQGTSMSSPHVAGAGALIGRAPSNLDAGRNRVRLDDDGFTEVVKEDGTTQADPFDMGGGRIDLTEAANAPLILDETTANYLAADPAAGGDPKDLNNASLGNSACVSAAAGSERSECDRHEVTWDGSVTGLERQCRTGQLHPGCR